MKKSSKINETYAEESVECLLHLVEPLKRKLNNVRVLGKKFGGYVQKDTSGLHELPIDQLERSATSIEAHIRTNR